jgi:HsdM N-terminal domain
MVATFLIPKSPMADHNYFSNLIWQIADLLRGPYRPPQYERVMLPMTVLRRFDCVLAPSKAKVLAEHELSKEKFKREALDARLNKAAGQRFHNHSPLDFERLKGDPDQIAQHLVSYIQGFSANVRRIFEYFVVAPPGCDDWAPPPKFDRALVKALARAHRWRRLLEAGRFGTLAELADAERISRSYVCRVLRLTLLAPDIVERILDGRPTVALPQLMQPFPVEWEQQREQFASTVAKTSR